MLKKNAKVKSLVGGEGWSTAIAANVWIARLRRLSEEGVSWSQVRLDRIGTNFNLYWVPPRVSLSRFQGLTISWVGSSRSFMVNRNLIRSLEDDSISAQLDSLLPEEEMEGIVLDGLEDLNQSFDVNQIVMARSSKSTASMSLSTSDSRAKVQSISMNGTKPKSHRKWVNRSKS